MAEVTPVPCDALVLGADEHTGLAAARNLHRDGIRVLGGGLDPSGYGFRSLALRARFTHPNPEKDCPGFIESVRQAVLRHKVRAILPCLDTAVIAVHENRQAFEGLASLGLAPVPAVEAIRDKMSLVRLATSLGIEMPRTNLMVGDPGDFPSDFPIPAIVKQRESGQLGPRKVIYCRTTEEVRRALRVYLDAGCPPIVQELIHGHGVQLIGMCRQGELVQAFQYRRLHEYSCSGGLGSLVVSESVDPGVLIRSANLLRALKWEGIVGVEFKLPPDRPDQPVLLEINARFVGFIDLAMAAGINFPSLQYRFAIGESIPSEQIPYRTGVRYQRWLLDTLTLIELLLDRPIVTGVPLPSRFRALGDYVAAYGPHVGSDSFQLRDPLPGLVCVWRGLPVIARTLLRTLRDRVVHRLSRGSR